jgi:3-methyladenine DNA glycosylase AlkD
MILDEVLEELESKKGSPEDIEGMARFGINPEKLYGIRIPVLRKMAKKIKKNHQLAQQLWDLGYRETMILGAMIGDPSLLTEAQIEKWVSSPYFNYWEVVDQACMNLFYLTDYAHAKAVEWIGREEEFVKRAGFSLIAVLAWKDKDAKDEDFINFFPFIKKESTDERNNVKKAVNWALRQIGKKNLNLNKKAIELAYQIQEIDSKTARWIAKDAIKELESDKIQSRIS